LRIAAEAERRALKCVGVRGLDLRVRKVSNLVVRAGGGEPGGEGGMVVLGCEGRVRECRRERVVV
jgi:hypothetical protein